MKIKSVSRFITLVLALLVAVAICWFAVTCASRPGSHASISAFLRPVAEPTPLPAAPLGAMATPPSAGEPPVGVFTDEEIAEIEKLPVGTAPPEPENNATPDR